MHGYLRGHTGCQGTVEERLRAWQEEGFSRRLWAKDPTLWVTGRSGGPVSELTDRLGWLTLPEAMRGRIDDLLDFAREVAESGTHHVVLLGMGGSSMAPEVFERTFGRAAGAPRLIVQGSAHPAAVRRVQAQVDLTHRLFVVSSKSRTTVETLSLCLYFWHP